MSETATADAPELIVLSDLHLGEGLGGEPPRYSAMEDFFFDEPFARLLAHLRWEHLTAPERLVLVLNGDIFDFLTVTRVPEEAEAARRGFKISRAERQLGLNAAPAKSVFKLDCILDGHPVFFAALAQFIAAGHRVELLAGNHDLELHFPEVRARLLERLASLPGAPTRAELETRLRFHPWFYLEPGRVYVEHGNQYEASNSVSHPRYPVLRRRGREPVLDYPLGSLFVRYFYNPVHRINPYTPKVISFEQYIEFLRRHNVLDLLRIARTHWPFFTRAIRPELPAPGTDQATGASEPPAAAELELSPLERQLDTLKIHPLTASKAALAEQMMKPVLRRLGWVSALGLGSLYVWLLLFNLIQATPWLAENVFAKAVLLVFLAMLTFVGLFWLGNALARGMRRRTDETVELCAQRAGEIARRTGVKLVLMGHTHVVDLRAVADGAATYANGGSWTAVDNPWERLHPDARRHTFLQVRDDQVTVCRWNDHANRIEPVPLFELPEDRDLVPGALGEVHRPPPPAARRARTGSA